MGRSSRSMTYLWVGMAAVACLVTAASFPGCGGGGGSTPEATVQALFAAMKAKDMNAMMKCFAPDVRQLFQEMKAVVGDKEVQERLMSSDRMPEKLEILRSQIEGEWATVETAVTIKGKVEKDKMRLRNINGVWLVDLPDNEKKKMKDTLVMMKQAGGPQKMLEAMKKQMQDAMKKMPKK